VGVGQECPTYFGLEGRWRKFDVGVGQECPTYFGLSGLSPGELTAEAFRLIEEHADGPTF
jgi:hypothetical protein